MPACCCVIGCKQIFRKGSSTKLYSFPPVYTKIPKLKTLSEERHKKWIAAINRQVLNPHTSRVCSKHFISGKKARLTDVLNPDWVPSLHLGYATKNSSTLSVGRYNRQKKKNLIKSSIKIDPIKIEPLIKIEPSIKIEPLIKIESLDQHIIEEPPLIKVETGEEEVMYDVEYLEEIYFEEEPTHRSIEVQTELSMIDIDNLCLKNVNSSNVQTDLSMKDIDNLNVVIQKRNCFLNQKDSEINSLKKSISILKMGKGSFENNDRKTKYFTGLNHYATLDTIYKAVEKKIPNCFRKSLNKFQVLILTLLKLKLDLPFTLLSYMFGISKQTASKKFNDCVSILIEELSSFVCWPDENVRMESTPEYFKSVFQNRLVVIIDSYELRTEKTDQPVEKAPTGSYKNMDTIKYLIGIAPSGSIIYTSKGFDGKSSDNFIVENSDFLGFLKPGDIVLSKGGVLILEAVKTKEIEHLTSSSVTPHKIQLEPFSIEDSKELANIQINVAQIISSLRQKYLMLSSQPLARSSKKLDENQAYIDSVVRTCCGLLNLTPSVKPSTLQFENESPYIIS